MSDSLKGGLKTSEGIFTAITILTSMVVNVLVALRVVEPSDSAGLTEVLAQGITAIVTAVVAGIVLVSYIRQRTTIKTEALKLESTKVSVTG